jgi:hypothetical protein
MATPVYYTGDTWPPMTGTVKDSTGAAVDISSADSLRMVAKISGAATVIEGAAANLTDGTDGKWEYTWAADDLSVAGDYVPEIEVTWDNASTPPKIETFRDDSQKFTVRADND